MLPHLQLVRTSLDGDPTDVAGNMAVGSSKTFLPLIVRHIDTATKEADRILLLHALKEVVLHSSPAHLEAIAESLWKPLFADSEQSQSQTSSNVDDAGDDGIRNVKAACIGKLTTAAPSKFLPQLQVCHAQLVSSS